MNKSSGVTARGPDTILINRAPGETRYALMAGDELVEVVHRRDSAIQSGAVYLGRVGAGVPGVSAVFVEIGDEVPGVLAVKGRPAPQGSAVPVVVIVPPRGDKGAELKAADLNIPEDTRAPRLLQAAPEPVVTWWTCYRDGITQVACAPKAEASRIKALLDPAAPVQEGAPGFFDGVDEAVEAALNPHVPLPSGGSLIIEHTAAVTAIDVNSGAGDPGTANSEALTAVAVELRRRNIAGHIVVDLIPSRKRAPLARLLADAVSPDPIQTNVAGVTPLGMVELTRRRVGLSLADALCNAAGELSAASVAYKLLRDAVRLAHVEKCAGVAASVAPDVIALLQEQLRPALEEATATIKGELRFMPRADFPRGRVELQPA